MIFRWTLSSLLIWLVLSSGLSHAETQLNSTESTCVSSLQEAELSILVQNLIDRKIRPPRIRVSQKSGPLTSLPPPDYMFPNFPIPRAVAAGPLIPYSEPGEGYYLLRKIGDTWRSFEGPNRFAVDSDPTWIISILGPRLARFLGFGMIDEKTMMVPNAKRLNSNIRRLNKKLRAAGLEEIVLTYKSEISKSEVASHFQGTEEIEVQYAEAFVRTLLYSRAFTFMEKEITHDTSHHALNVLLTQAQLVPLFARSLFATRFADFVRVKTAKNPNFKYFSNREIREAFLNLLFQILARDADNFSGTIPINLLAYQNREDKISDEMSFRILTQHLGQNAGDFADDKLVVVPDKKYTLRDNLERVLFEGIQPAFQEPIETLKNPSMKDFLQMKNGKEARDIIRANSSAVFAELRRLFQIYVSMPNSGADAHIVTYNSDFSVQSGLVSPEHPLRALFRRIAELNSVILN